MAKWKVEPTWKKSVIERTYYSKGEEAISIETGWRWGEFLVYTEDDNPPKLEAGDNLYNCDYETELVATYDGCWEEIDYDDCNDDTREWLEDFFEENSWLDLEEHGWTQYETEMIIDCDLKITRMNDDDDTEGESFTTGDNDENVTYVEEQKEKNKSQVDYTPGAAWPFNQPTESTEFAKFTCEDCGYSTEDIMDLVDNPNDDDKGAYLCPECGGKVDLK